jgi:hypothetical protein
MSRVRGARLLLSINILSSSFRVPSSTMVSVLSVAFPSASAKSVLLVSAGRASHANRTTTWLVVAINRRLQYGLFSFI